MLGTGKGSLLILGRGQLVDAEYMGQFVDAWGRVGSLLMLWEGAAC